MTYPSRVESQVAPIDPRSVPDPVNGKPINADAKNTLLLLACGSAKIETDVSVPLYNLYSGPIWQDLRANGRDIPLRNIFVLSGKHGFASVMTYARPYEEKISAQKVDALIERGIFANAPSPVRGGMPGPNVYGNVYRPETFSGKAVSGPYSQVIIYGSGEYRRAFNAITAQLIQAGVIAPTAPIVATHGSILQQRKQFNEFLRAAQGAGAALDVTVEQVRTDVGWSLDQSQKSAPAFQMSLF
ncbi:hypothetical protein MesoLjLc_51130 [Mesorhizobium sp. L-8-10]|uniref:hypothetical protein n=1 Tax=Mesorhizobium sp. L-8-10 TaxID=2744523 RepID=UPI0019294CCA|nr:hypothetical protein [Mesorhizobium sp. L-8-10]BCH33183.1 hypothetical protein MesoLjLc_51130 [Mesorhizobium sp. L-8-10]